ncbi:hypothetical protein [Kandleria vitulina]|nr:hypothetical protein [Kandleria vitulina]MEE0988156.1 hypothetical protein [Kandleria vitulina]
MIKLLKAEYLKQRHDRTILGLCLGVLLILSFMMIWSTCLADYKSQQVLLEESGKAGLYGLFFYITVLRRLFGLLYGYHVIDIEFINNRQDFFIKNTGRIKIIMGKIILGMLVLFVMSFLSFILPFIISLLIFHQFSLDIALAFHQMIVTWLMAIGSMLLGMLLRFIFNEFLLFTIIISMLEFFSSFFPHQIIDIWTRCDGFFYLSQALVPLKNQLKGLRHYQIYLPHSFHLLNGFIIWMGILVLLIIMNMYIIKRKDLTNE